MANILSIAQSGIAAAQAGMATTGHNITNQATPGYSRQQITQASMGGQNVGFGFIGNGTNIVGVERVYNEFLSTQASTAQSSASQLGTYYAQINNINNMIADATTGLTPSIAGFFKGVQDLVANPATAASRQAMLSSAETLASRFNGLNDQLNSLNDGVNTRIAASVTNINSYAHQISDLNKAISKAQSADGQTPNDLMDQRDLMVAELSKETKVSVVKQDGAYSVFIGNGQPLVVGGSTYELKTVASATDLGRLDVGYETNGVSITIPESSLVGGNLSGLFEFRRESLDPIQNSLGLIAISLASTFNAQHRLGQDQTGALGGDFFNVAEPVVNVGISNAGDAVLDASLSDVSKLTGSDYRLAYDGTNYTVTRLSDKANWQFGAGFSSATIDGVDFSLTSGAMAAGDQFLIKPTANGAADFSVLVKNTAAIASATPISTSATLGNAGTATVSAGKINSDYATSGLGLPVTMTYNATDATFSLSPATADVTVTSNGVATIYTAGTDVPYTAGATITLGGAEIQIAGAPADGDTFAIKANTNGNGDNRNMLMLGELQTTKTMNGGTATYNEAYAQLVSLIGNKTRELEVNSKAQSTLLSSIKTSQQSESGVNLDEEATNLLRYQQAYQASARVMQTASDMFDVLISLGR